MSIFLGTSLAVASRLSGWPRRHSYSQQQLSADEAKRPRRLACKLSTVAWSKFGRHRRCLSAATSYHQSLYSRMHGLRYQSEHYTMRALSSWRVHDWFARVSLIRLLNESTQVTVGIEWTKSDVFFHYAAIMPHRLKTDIYTVWTISIFAIDYSLFRPKCVHLSSVPLL